MTASLPLIEIDSINKHYGVLQPLRIRRLAIAAGDRITLHGLDAPASEALLYMITGASLPDEGTLRIAGRDTREIATDTEWLTSLDRFGMVTARAVLISAMPIVANIALPLTLSIDPMSDETRSAVEMLADTVGLAHERLGAPASSLTPRELVRVHLARALALKPQMLLLEHPTAALHDAADARELGRVLRSVADRAGLGWLALTEDREFTRASGATRFRLKPETGDVVKEGAWWNALIK